MRGTRLHAHLVLPCLPLQGIEPEKDPYSLDLHDPRHPMNIRRREESKKSAREKRRPRNDAL